MRISDWSSDVCSSDLLYTKLESGKIDLAAGMFPHLVQGIKRQRLFGFGYMSLVGKDHPRIDELTQLNAFVEEQHVLVAAIGTGHHTQIVQDILEAAIPEGKITRSEEHTSELKSLMRKPYDDFYIKQTQKTAQHT